MPYLDPNPLPKLKVGDKVLLELITRRTKYPTDLVQKKEVVVTKVYPSGFFSVSGKRKDEKYNLFQPDGLPRNKTKGQIMKVLEL